MPRLRSMAHNARLDVGYRLKLYFVYWILLDFTELNDINVITTAYAYFGIFSFVCARLCKTIHSCSIFTETISNVT